MIGKQKLGFNSKTKTLSVECNDIDILAKDKVKYLGVTIDQDMSGSFMAGSIVKKINTKIEFLYRIQSI